ncbi:MAG: threonine--tRNA ligase [Ardenticatenales bacterium]|nr:threonine--tRNA ligase [Ardenticatenales bacterium]
MSESELSDRLYRLRHSMAHVMAQAVRDLHPDVRFAIGPPIDDGFYYDFDLGMGPDGRPTTFSPEDLAAIEKRMRQIIAGKHPFQYREVSADEARALFAGQPYKLELIEGLAKGDVDEYGVERDDADGDGSGAPGDAGDAARAGAHAVVISTYRQDAFEDLCKGPHVEHTGQLPADAFKLLSVAGAYWRGDEHNPMLQRIYGTAWLNKKDLAAHLLMLEEAKKRDHRKLGRELDIFTFDDEVGPGLPLWLPNGGILIEEIERLAKEAEARHGYQRVRTPNLAKEDLFLHSGHLPYYAESMYPPMELEGVRYYVKPMNCPMHHKIFASRPRSYRDLPLRLAEYGTCYRFEKSGELIGLLRVRSLQMNDAHIYCSAEQFEVEFLDVIAMYLEYFALFGIERYVMRFSTHHKRGLGKKYVDNAPLWLHTEDMVRRAMHSGNIPFVEVPDEAAFYGPKIDVQIWSATGREFTLATNQVDFAQPERFDLTYTSAGGGAERPLCIHRAPLSTHERLIGFLIEHYAGAFPVWLAPEQARVIPITEDHNGYAERVAAELRAAGLRVAADLGADRMNAKIRDAQLMKVPYMLVVGDQEMADGTVAIRRRDGSRGEPASVGTFAADVVERVRARAATL